MEQRGESKSAWIGGYKVHIMFPGKDDTKKGVILQRGCDKAHLVQRVLEEFRMPAIRAEYVEVAPENRNDPDENEVTLRFRFDRPRLSELRDISLDEFRGHFDPEAPVMLETDGACSGNPGPGGWGYILAQGNVCTRQYGAQSGTTSNKMELEALIQGLSQPFFTRTCYLVIESDSKGCIHAMMDGAKVWEANGWGKIGGGDVANQPQVSLNGLIKRFYVIGFLFR
jgi:ribonuclease HI